MKGTLGVRLPDMDLLAHTLFPLVEGALRQRILDPEGCDLDRLFTDLRNTIELMVKDRLRRVTRSSA